MSLATSATRPGLWFPLGATLRDGIPATQVPRRSGSGGAVVVHPGRDRAMTADAWRDPDARCVALYLDGADAPDLAADGSPMVDDDFLVLANAWWEPLDFAVPPTRPGQTWQREIDTFDPTATASALVRAADVVAVGPPFSGGAAGVVDALTGMAVRRGSRRRA